MLTTNLIVDLNNITKVTRWGLKNPKSHRQKEKLVAQKIFKDVVTSVMRHAQKLKCDGIIITADSRQNWRRDIYPEYKRKDHTEDLYLEETYEALDILERFFKEQTACLFLKTPRTEADDIIGVLTQNSDQSFIILSTDMDYGQLVSEKVRLFALGKQEFVEVDDSEYFLFEKCIRGDTSDNIEKAFVGVRKTRLQAAWDDDLEMLNLINELRPDGKTVGEMIEFNAALMDLRLQPDYIRQAILRTIEKAETGSFNEIRAMQFLGEIGIPKSNDMFAGGEKYKLTKRPIV